MKHTPLFVSTLWSITLLVPLLARAGHLPFGVALVAVTACGLAALGLSLQAARLRWLAKQPVPPALLAAVPLALLVLGPLLGGLARYPWRSDVAAADEAPRFVWLEPTEPVDEPAYSDEMRRENRERYPDLKPLPLPGSPARALGQTLVAAGYLPGWRVTKVDAIGLHVEGTARSPLFRTETQLAFTIRKRTLGSSIEVRSRSKLPLTDFGENARMIQLFGERLTQSRMCRPPADFAAKRS